METPSYQYQPLQHSDSVRILILHPSPDELDPIECTICHERLSGVSLDYQAVSYTWGNSGLTHVIHCNDAKLKLSVGKSCHAALRRLRLPEEHRALWIDAVCINQKDLSERGHQVRMMKDVYDFASGVVVMLNDVVPECRLLLDELAEAERILDELAKAGRTLDLSRANPVRNRPSSVIVRQLETLFEDPWFKRTWVLQEVHDKDLVTIMYGSATIPFDAIRTLYFGYDGTKVTRSPWSLPLRLMSDGLQEYTTPQFNLWNLLFWSRECLATDPRDKVFALKSLVGPGQEDLDLLIDYVTSVGECFKRVAEFLLPVLGLRLLTATRHPHGLDMASWIPDWSQTLPLQFGSFYVETFETEGLGDWFSPTNIENQERALISYTYNECLVDPILHVIGCQYARIVECSRVLQFVDIDDVDTQMLRIYNKFDDLRRYLNEESKIDSSETNGHFSGKIFDGKIYGRIKIPSINQTIAMSLMDGLSLDYNLRRLAGTFDRTLVSNCLTDHGKFLTPHQYVKTTILPQYEHSQLYESLQECSIALMQDGGLVIVPGAAQDGDVVCIIAGAIAPCLLRQRRDGSWMLVSGDCHIFGDTRSTLAVSDAYVDSHRSQAETFVLR